MVKEFENETYFKELVKGNGLNLFLGSGFSVLAKNQTGRNLLVGSQLKEQIIKDFSLKQLENRTLSRICSHLKRNRKGDFYHYLNEWYTVNEFDERYYNISNLPIKNIITINIDDLVENIFRNKKLNKIVHDVEVTGRIENLGISLYKLHGSVTYPYDKEMLFSTEELATAIASDRSLWHSVALKIASCPTLFWGTSLEDFNIVEMLQPETINNRPSFQKWIVVLPGKKYDIDAEEYKSMGFNIIRATTRELLEYFSEFKTQTKENQQLEKENNSQLEELFSHYIVDKILTTTHPVRPISYFYEGADPTWHDIIKGNIEKISHYNRVVEKILSQGNVYISGFPGCGKTTLLMQLAICPEIKGLKFFFTDITKETAIFLGEQISDKRVYVFLDNLADNIDAYQILYKIPNFTLIIAERDLNFEQIKHLVNIKSRQIVDISELPEYDIQKICNSMNKQTLKFYDEKVSLFEIVYRLWAGDGLKSKIQKLILDLEKESEDILEFYTLMTYVRYTRSYASMDMLYAYYSGGTGFDYKKIFEYVTKLNSLIDDANYVTDLDQDLFSLRSRVFSEVSLKYLPPYILSRVMNRFHTNVHKSLIFRYDVFRRKAFDADITTRAFLSVDEGKMFYETLLSKVNNPFIKHQYALYLWRKRRKSDAWKQIDAAYTETNGNIFTIGNTHAMILFDNNIDKDEDSHGTVRETLTRSFEVLEKCLERDSRKSYHVIKFADHAIRFYEKYNDDKAKTLLKKAKEQLDDILSDTNQYLPFRSRQECKTLQKKINKIDLTSVNAQMV